MRIVVVDSSALVSIVLEEPDAARFVAALTNSDKLLMTAANWLEAQIVVHVRAPPRHATLLALADAIDLEIVTVDAELADAAFIAFVQFGKGRRKAALNFGDCFSYALATTRDLPLLFKGDEFAKTNVTSALVL